MKRVFPLLSFLCLGSLIAATAARGSKAKAKPPVVTVTPDGDICRAVDVGDEVLLVDKDAAKVIGAAIRAVAQAGHGGTVLIERGTYLIDTPIKMETGVRLVGAGGLVRDSRPADRYPTVLRAGKASLLAVVDMFEARGARLEHLEVDGAGRRQVPGPRRRSPPGCAWPVGNAWRREPTARPLQPAPTRPPSSTRRSRQFLPPGRFL